MHELFARTLADALSCGLSSLAPSDLPGYRHVKIYQVVGGLIR